MSIVRRVLTAGMVSTAVAVSLSAANGASSTQTLGPFKGFLVAVHDAAAGDGASETSRVETALRAVLGPGWSTRPTGTPGEYRVEPARTRAALSVSDAWEQVHRLRASGSFERAEPLFVNQAQMLEAPDDLPPPGECDQTWTDGWGDAAPVPEALRDTRWSLGPAGANVIAAWKLFEGKEITPGEGVSIGHPDTGYLPHPMTADARQDPGFDFATGTSDARDVAAAGFLQWPGHGTRTGSVIAGRRDFGVTAGAARKISGVAYGARLMEMRVATRVLLLDRIDLDMGNLALAIRAAAIGDPNFVRRRADVISMSLGGAPSRAVQDALKVAARHNVMVLAAAGNDVPSREVVFPARYDEVLAIAGSNVLSKPWKGTSAGKTIAITAPGEDVWTARQMKKGDVVYNCIAVGTGTSYAVATTAGVAALWLSYHGAEMAGVRDRSATFRAILKSTARPVDGWDMTRHGAGIIDAEKVLRAPLAATPVVSDRLLCDDLDALATLFDRDRLRTAAQLLFGSAERVASACRNAVHLGDEIAFDFVSQPAVMQAVALFNRGRIPLEALRLTLLDGDVSPTLRRQLSMSAGMLTH